MFPFHTFSDSNDTHLVTITRLNEKSGLGNVIRKLRTGFKKEDDDLTRFWMPDNNSKECYECGFKFSTIRRRHHCRICGQIFCSRCCSRKIDGDKVGYAPNTKVRSCNYCFNAINNCVKPNQTQQQLPQQQQHLKSQESIETDNDMENRLSNPTSSCSNQLPKAFHDLFGNDATNEMNLFRSPRRRSIDESTTNLRRLSIKKQDSKMQSTPHFINETPMRKRIDKQKKQLFVSSNEESLKLDQPFEPSWVKEIDQRDSSSFDNLNSEIESIEIVMNLEEDSNLFKGIVDKMMSETDDQFDQDFLIKNDENKDEIYSSNEQIKVDTIDNLIKSSAESTSLITFYSDDQMNEDLINPILFNREEQIERNQQDENARHQFDCVYEKFFNKLALQLLKKEKLSSSWFLVLKEMITQITNTVKPNSDILEEMDIRKHVKIKTITGGNKQDSQIINGVVFTKHVAHRKMRKEIENPKILLLNCPIVFRQRTFQKFTSLEELFRQENNYLENLIEKIASFKPNIIIVDKIVSIKAQELLCKKKITVVYNVKSNILYKISRLTGGDIVDSVDAQINCPKFGECDSFYLKTFNNNQTLMFFDGCKPDSGCTVLLRGSIFKKELKKVKEILEFLIFCDYNWKYEKAFLLSSSASLNQLAFNEFVQFYEQNDKKSNQRSKDQTQENQKIVLTHLNNNDNQDPLMNNRSNISNLSSMCNPIDGLESSLKQQQKQQITKENLKNMCNFINDQILSISPFVYCKLPYLLTNDSDKCLIKKFISYEELFNSIRFQEYVNSNKICLMVDDAPYKKEESFIDLKKNQIHPFLLTDLREGADSERSQTLRALYRSSDPIKLNNRIHRSKDDENDDEITDPFNIQSHQLFPVLYCNYSLNTPQNPFCIQPMIMEMVFYVDHDFSLGNYLRRYCFTKTIKCECGNSIIEHISKFSHTNGSIYVRCKKLNKTMKRPNSEDIITWSWCQICKTSSQSKILNKEALSLSFGKFLQLKIHGNHFRRINCEQSCSNHSLFHDHFQYFAYQDMVASFKYYPVILREIVLPSTKLKLKVDISTFDQLTAEFQDIHQLGFQIMSKIFEQICAYQAENDHDNNDLQFKLMFTAEVNNRSELKKKLDEIHQLIENENKTQQLRLIIMNKIIFMKRLIAKFVSTWNGKLNEFETNLKKKEDRLSSVVARNSKFPRLHSFDVDQQNAQQILSTNKLNVRSSGSFSRQNSDQYPIIRELLEGSSTNESGSFNLNNSIKREDDQQSKNQSKTDSSSINSIIGSFKNSRDDLNRLNGDEFKKIDLNVSDQQLDNSQNNIIDKLASLDKSNSSESISSIVFGCTPGK